jgi:hypothetical protein
VSSCGNKNKSAVSNLVKVHRFEKELFTIDLYNFKQGASELKTKYPKFLSLFTNRIIETGDTSSENFYDNLKMFTTDQAVYNIYKRTENKYADFTPYSESLNKAFETYHKYFPNALIPEIYTYVSGFNQSIVTTEDFVGVSLEKYLGSSEPMYNELSPALPLYERYRMNPENLVPDIVRAWIVTTYENGESPNDNLLAEMIREGRSIYVLKKVMPDIADSILWGFDDKKMKFCKENEVQMWTYLVGEKLLFISDQFRINQFISEGPFTKDFSQDSPARAAVWIGYRIVEEYMKHNKNMSFEALLKENDFQQILSESRYNP